jgi:hypothetical protein
VVLLFVVVELVLRLEIGNFCFSPKGRQGEGPLVLLLARRRKRRRLRVRDVGKDEALPLVVKFVDVIIFIILVILLSVMPFCVKFREKTSDFSRERTTLRAYLKQQPPPPLFGDDDSDDDDSDDDESDLLGGVKTAASVVVVSVVVFAPFSLFENDQKRTRMPFASFFPKEKSFSVLGDIVVV